jgi:hypothetical protein
MFVIVLFPMRGNAFMSWTMVELMIRSIGYPVESPEILVFPRKKTEVSASSVPRTACDDENIAVADDVLMRKTMSAPTTKVVVFIGLVDKRVL